MYSLFQNIVSCLRKQQFKGSQARLYDTNTFIQHGSIHLFKSDGEDIYNVLEINTFH